MFDIVEVGDWPPVGDEQMGMKQKCWLEAPDGVRWLFKQKTRPHTVEDCTEKLAAELADLFGIPHATAELAGRTGNRGVITRNLLPDCDAVEMVHGNSLLASTDPAYETTRRFHNPQHTALRVQQVLAGGEIGLPLGFSPGPPICDAFDLFLGYLMFDAWIGNTDRHHENWAVLRLTDGKRLVLCPSYDHATCLGHNVGLEQKRRRLVPGNRADTVGAFAARALSALFASEDDSKGMPTVVAFVTAAADRLDASRYWLDRLAAVDPGRATDIVNRMPDAMMPEVARQFAVAMLDANRARLLSAPC